MERHEYLYGSMNIKVSESISNILVSDCIRFGFIKNGEANFSGFINNIIPKLSKLREEKHNELLKYNNFNEIITRIVEKNIYNVYLKEFDLEDDNTEIISFRINKKNKDDFIYIDDNMLEVYNMDFTNYIRSLLKEYSIKSTIKRELCYYSDILKDLNKAIKLNQLIKVYGNNEYMFVPIVLEQAHKKDCNYLVGIDEKDENILLIPLCEIKHVSFLNKNINIGDETVKSVAEYVYQVLNEEDDF
jgi:hypothetical protein